jgi:hypothetical protein
MLLDTIHAEVRYSLKQRLAFFNVDEVSFLERAEKCYYYLLEMYLEPVQRLVRIYIDIQFNFNWGLNLYLLWAGRNKKSYLRLRSFLMRWRVERFTLMKFKTF